MDQVHDIDPAWRIVGAAQASAHASAVGSFLAHLEDNLQLAEHLGDKQVTGELLRVRGLMRSRYQDYRRAAERLEDSLNGQGAST